MNWITKIIYRSRQQTLDKVLKRARVYYIDVDIRINMMEKYFTLFQKQGRVTEYVEVYSKLAALKSIRDRENTTTINKVNILMI